MKSTKVYDLNIFSIDVLYNITYISYIISQTYFWFYGPRNIFCRSENQDSEPADIENETVDTPKRIISEDYTSGTLNGMMNPFLSQPYITCTNLLYATCFLIVQVFIVALHLKRRK